MENIKTKVNNKVTEILDLEENTYKEFTPTKDTKKIPPKNYHFIKFKDRDIGTIDRLLLYINQYSDQSVHYVILDEDMNIKYEDMNYRLSGEENLRKKYTFNDKDYLLIINKNDPDPVEPIDEIINDSTVVNENTNDETLNFDEKSLYMTNSEYMNIGKKEHFMEQLNADEFTLYLNRLWYNISIIKDSGKYKYPILNESFKNYIVLNDDELIKIYNEIALAILNEEEKSSYENNDEVYYKTKKIEYKIKNIYNEAVKSVNEYNSKQSGGKRKSRKSKKARKTKKAKKSRKKNTKKRNRKTRRH